MVRATDHIPSLGAHIADGYRGGVAARSRLTSKGLSPPGQMLASMLDSATRRWALSLSVTIAHPPLSKTNLEIDVLSRAVRQRNLSSKPMMYWNSARDAFP